METEVAALQLGREAYVYLYPMVKNYLGIYQFGIDAKGCQYKGPINQINNMARAFTPDDTGVITPNSDLLYSFLILDLRAEPIVVTLPGIEKHRYYSLQLVDLYTNNVDYIGTRKDGNGGGNFLLAGPGWKGETPPGITRVVRFSTQLGFSQLRTQLFEPADIDQVRKIQAGYKSQTLSACLGKPSAPATSEITWPALSEESFEKLFWKIANFLLPFIPPLSSEAVLRARLKAVGMGKSGDWPPPGLDPEFAANIVRGGKLGRKDIAACLSRVASSVGLFGTPDEMAGKYVERAAGAMGGVYGNNAEETLCLAHVVDADGKPFDSGRHDYRIRFAPGGLPQVDAFWSLTMYDAVSRFLIHNPLDRYLINSPMIDKLVRDADGAITLYLQHKSPGTAREANWLPAPDGRMAMVMRLYLPRPEVAAGGWKEPAIMRA